MSDVLDETLVQYLTLRLLGKAPDIRGTALQPKATWALLGPCAEMTEAKKRAGMLT